MAARAPRSLADRIFLGMLLVCGPLALASPLFSHGVPVFVLCCLAILPLARTMGEATEALAHKLGSGIGGLLNATFGNAAELILALAALHAGKVQVVKASLTGSILGNLLLILGVAMLAGGIRREKQKFNPTAAMAGMNLLFLALVAIGIPDAFHLAGGRDAVRILPKLSVGIAVVMLGVYVLSLLFAIRTHAHLYTDAPEVAGHAPWAPRKAFAILLAATVGVAVVAEILIHAVEDTIKTLGFTETFLGIVVIAIVGNAAEHSTAVLVAVKDRMNLAFNIAIESSKQIALFVAPVLVLVSPLFGPTMTLEFTHMEVLGIAVGVGAATLAALDGESNWLEGAMLLAVYAILGVTFFFTTP
ncbi:MAG: calcium/proton exchanger [Planctomycetales bacterium]|nr:calcium/proton exchanger [Planctomycetales bacterium]